MDRDSALLEEAYLKIAEAYYDREDDPYHQYRQNLSFFVKKNVLNTTYIVHFYCNRAEVSGKPNNNKKDLDYEYENEEFLVWDVSKTPEILKFYNEVMEDGIDFVSNLTDEIINKAIINYPKKNPNFIEKYRRNPVYGVLIRDAYDIADDFLYAGFQWDLKHGFSP